MNRRAKLSLVPDKGVTKKQAAGFEVASPEESGQARAEAPPLAAKARAPGGAEAASPRGEQAKVSAAPPAPWPSGRQLVKVVAVVAVVALSLFLFRRRLF